MTTQKSLSPRASLDLILLSAIWGASFVAIRVALDEVPVLTSVAHRVLWAALALWCVIWWMRLPLPRSPRVWGACLVMGLLNNAIPFGLMAWGQLYIESGLTAIFNAATAIFGVLLAALFFADERLTRRKALGVGLGFLGVASAIGIQNLLAFNLQSLAQLAILAGTVSYACAGVWARVALTGLPPQIAAAGMLTGSSLIMVPLAWVLEGPMTLSLDPATLLAIGYYALIATAGAYLLYYRILAAAGSGNLMLVTLTLVPFAIVLGAVIRGESLGPEAYVGFGLLALGLLILSGRLLPQLR